jgi:nitroreductase
VAYSPAALGPRDDAAERVRQSAQYLADRMHEVPVMLLPLSWGVPPEQRAGQAGFWGSLLPAAWSFCLAARSRGLGTTWTSMHLVHEQEAADVLGIPYDRCVQGGLFPIAYTKGTDFKPAPRKEVEQVVHWNQW